MKTKKIRTIELNDLEWNDLISAVGFTIKIYKNSKPESPKFVKALTRLNKRLWKLL